MVDETSLSSDDNEILWWTVEFPLDAFNYNAIELRDLCQHIVYVFILLHQVHFINAYVCLTHQGFLSMVNMMMK